MSSHPLDSIFHPRSVALVGASRNLERAGSEFWYGLVDMGFPEHGTFYPVNPNVDEIAGHRVYPSVLDCPGPVDHVISIIPSRLAADLVEQCIQKGVRSLHFFTAGFAESGDQELAALERRLIERAREGGVRVFGPNCMGLYVPEEHISFASIFPKEPGNVFALAQSGGNAMEIVNGLGHRGVRFSKVVSFGNARDIAAAELFEYAATDEQSDIVLAYIEGVPDGQRLLRAMKACATVKPTIVLKGGISESGARAVSSHTASLAGSKEIFEAMCRQAGAMRVETMDELHDLTIAVGTKMRALSGRHAMLIGGGGGFSVLSADAIAREGLDLPELHPETTARLRKLIPIAGNSIRNPIDASFIGDDREGVAREMLDIAATAPGIDLLLVMLHRAPSLIGDERMPSRRMRHDTAGPEPTPEQRAHDREERIERSQHGIDEFAELQAGSGRPFVVVGWNERRDGELPREILEHAYRQGVAVFPTVPRAARASRLLLEWRARREGLPAIV